jgi:DNA end-binding protein Ku
VRGFQISKEKYIQVTEEELEALEAEANRSIDLKEFVPLETVDPVYFENSYYLGPDKGGEKPYRLLADALEKMKRVAVAQLVSSGKEQLVLIRAYQNGLIMHTAYYADEVRDFGEIPKGDGKLGKQELELGEGLIEQLSTEEFRPDKFKDEYRLRVLSVLEKKAKTGEEITEAPHPVRQPGRVIDLMEALKKSLGSGPAGEKPAARKKRRAR